MEPFSCLTYQWDLCNVTMFNADALKIDLLLLQAEGLKNEIVFQKKKKRQHKTNRGPRSI